MGDYNGVSCRNIWTYAAEITEELKVVLNYKKKQTILQTLQM
jgi:hypothetical protein